MPCDFCESSHVAACERCEATLYAGDCEDLAEMMEEHDLRHRVAESVGLERLPNACCHQCGEVLQPWNPDWEEGFPHQAMGGYFG